MIDRRTFLQLGIGALAYACASTDPTQIHARPGKVDIAATPGVTDLGLERPALLYVPQNPHGPFALALNGAGGRPDRIIERFRPDADAFGVTLVAPKSYGTTWDAIRGDFGPDVAFIDRALTAAFDRCTVDRHRIAVAGFSDGATYALALGLANGDLFSHVLAFSPGFLIPVEKVGSAKFFLSHGTRDEILPIDQASRRIARDLRRMNLAVKLREFDGPHTVPPEIAREAFAWFVS